MRTYEYVHIHGVCIGKTYNGIYKQYALILEQHFVFLRYKMSVLNARPLTYVLTHARAQFQIAEIDQGARVRRLSLVCGVVRFTQDTQRSSMRYARAQVVEFYVNRMPLVSFRVFGFSSYRLITLFTPLELLRGTYWHITLNARTLRVNPLGNIVFVAIFISTTASTNNPSKSSNTYKKAPAVLVPKIGHYSTNAFK